VVAEGWMAGVGGTGWAGAAVETRGLEKLGWV
jgi:hypothetical protein